MIPLYLPYYASTNAAAVSACLGRPPVQYEEGLRQFFRTRYAFDHVFFTKSCTHALETLALLLELKPGDEVIVPSYTYVSTANAFALYGATIVFADSNAEHPNADIPDILGRITAKTKAVVVMHYGGAAVHHLQALRKTCDEQNIFLIEDAAHCIHAFDNDRALGSTGHAAVFSFHESKNIGCVEGGMLVLQHTPWLKRVEALLNKGTNRTMFERKETARYEWVDLGSSYRMDVMHLCLLHDQLAYVNEITEYRLKLFDFYLQELSALKKQGLLDFYIPLSEQRHNAHICWVVLETLSQRDALREFLLKKNVYSTFHYLALHKSPYGKRFAASGHWPNAERFENGLLRIPLYYPMPLQDAETVTAAITSFYRQ